MDLVVERRRKRGKRRHQWRKRGRSRDTLSLCQSWLLTRWCHVSYAHKRTAGTNNGWPQLSRTKRLTWRAHASNFGWKEGKKYLESLPSLPWPSQFELHKNVAFLGRVWSLHSSSYRGRITIQSVSKRIRETLGEAKSFQTLKGLKGLYVREVTSCFPSYMKGKTEGI